MSCDKKDEFVARPEPRGPRPIKLLRVSLTALLNLVAAPTSPKIETTKHSYRAIKHRKHRHPRHGRRK